MPRVVCPVTVRLDAVVVASVEVPVTVKNPVVVALTVVKFVKAAVIAFKNVAKKLVLVAFVVELLTAEKLFVAVALVTVRLAIDPVVA